MKMNKKCFVAVLCILFVFGSVWAEDEAFDEFGSFGDSFESSDSFFGSFDEGVASASALSWSGRVDSFVRLYTDTGSSAESTPVASDPTLTLGLTYAGDKTDFDAKVKLSHEVVIDYPMDVLEELTLRSYLGEFVVEAGKMKVVWGKGDKLHVLDNFNATDFTDFMIPDYIDRRIALPMVRVVYNGLEQMSFEAVYTPFMTADRFATEGLWVPGSYTTLKESVTTIALANAQALFGSGNDALAVAYLASITPEGLQPDTNTLEYGQYGVRFTGTVNTFDWGASYYLGRNKQPSADLSKGPSSLPTLAYDRLQVFGLEGATVFGPLNFRGEFAYNLTDDIDGDDPWVSNNSVGWVFGFDVGFPVGNLSFNVQNIGSYTLKNDKISTVYDVDYNAEGTWSNNKIVFALSDSFLHEKLSTECNLIWGVENGDLMVMPKITYSVTEGLDASLSGMYIYASENSSEFYDFRNNSFVQAKVAYSF